MTRVTSTGPCLDLTSRLAGKHVAQPEGGKVRARLSLGRASPAQPIAQLS
jgi:hypothetical protein